MWLRRIGSSLFWLFILISSMLLFPIAVLIRVVTAPFDKRLVILHRFTCLWASLYTWLNPVWRVSVEGREKIHPSRSYIMVANHASLVDILILFRLFTHFKWVSKVENFRVPFVGWNMRLNRYIQLRRGDKDSIAEMMRTCVQNIREGSSIMMFPEGTRSDDGNLREFKHGAFTLAKETRQPLLLIAIHGTADALPKRGFVLQGRHAIRVRVLDEIPYESFADKDVETMVREVRALIGRDLGQAL